MWSPTHQVTRAFWKHPQKMTIEFIIPMCEIYPTFCLCSHVRGLRTTVCLMLLRIARISCISALITSLPIFVVLFVCINGPHTLVLSSCWARLDLLNNAVAKGNRTDRDKRQSPGRMLSDVGNRLNAATYIENTRQLRHVRHS